MDDAGLKQWRTKICDDAKAYAAEKWPEKPFDPEHDLVPVSGRVFDGEDVASLVESSLDFWLTAGRFAATFEREFPKRVGTRHCTLTNSGSSANLLAMTSLTSHRLGEERLKPGDEVITVATGFPTTVNPIYQNKLVPVYIDITLPTYGADITRLEEALSPKTRAIMMAHTLGNPFNLDVIMDFAQRHNLYVVEDACDALGGTYHGKNLGTFGDLATFSFYPAHHITMGEGGAVVTDDEILRKNVESFRDWGRDCWCKPGACNSCGKRFEWQLGDLPMGYDHKYIYSHIGYNLKVTDMQAAVGCSQLKKLDHFVEKRRENFRTLTELLRPVEDKLILPEAEPGSDPSWFGFPITLREGVEPGRKAIVEFLEGRRIATRQLFAGNIIRQPAYKDLQHRIVGPLDVSDRVMRDTFWIGVYPGLSRPHLEYAASCLTDVLRNPALAKSIPLVSA